MAKHHPRGRDRRQTEIKKHGDTIVLATGVTVFALVGYLTLRDPSLVYGRAIGPANLAIVLSIVLAAVSLSCFSLQYLIDRDRWNTRSGAIFFVFALLMSAALTDGALWFVDSRFEFSESLHKAKVVYHCVEKYESGKCVSQLTHCPQCKSVLSAGQRSELQAKLTAFADKMDKEFAGQQSAAVDGGPLTEATDNWRRRQRAPASSTQSK